MKWRKRRGTLNKTSGKISAGTPATSLAVKTISKKKKVHKIRGKWLVTPVNKAPNSSGDNTDITHATSLSKKTPAKDSTSTPAKMPSKSQKIPSKSRTNPSSRSRMIPLTTPVNNGAKTFLKKSVFKVTSSSNLGVQEKVNRTADNAMTGLLFEGLGKLKRRQRFMEDLVMQKGSSQPHTNGEKEEEEIIPAKKKKISDGEKESKALKLLLGEIKLKKKEKDKLIKKKANMSSKLENIDAHEKTRKNGSSNKQKAFTQVKKGAAITASNTNSESKKEAKLAYGAAENGNAEEINLKKKEKKKERKKKQQQKRRAAKRKLGKQMTKASLKKEAPAKKKERFINPDGSKRSLKGVEKVKKRRSG